MSEEMDAKKQKIRDRYKGKDDGSIIVIPAQPQENLFQPTSVKRVAVYARVSTDGINQTSSYELQKNYYEDMIKKRENWELVRIYADEGISGTSLKHRDSFVRMITDCKTGDIDLIITKNVSRFARNIVDCIGYVRELKGLHKPVGVFFESEHIYTLDDDSEMALSFLATLAQEESHVKSNTMNASIDMRFKMGIFLTPVLLGYDHDENGNLIINEREAATVRFIFFSYLFGYTTAQIADALTELGRETKRGNTYWSSSSVLAILTNERYCGDLLARKTFTPNYLDHKSKKNTYQKPKYRREDHHDPIITREDFFAVQKIIRTAKYGSRGYFPELKVVKNGFLAGYVTVHPKWAGFVRDDYVHVSESVDIPNEENQKDGYKYTIEKGSFNLSGYELVRKAFLSTYGEIEVTIYPNHYFFNIPAVNKMPENQRIELLVMPKRKMLAVRPTNENSRYRIHWSKIKDGKVIPKIINGQAYLPTLYTIFGWDEDSVYKVRGIYKKNNDEKIILFDISEAVLVLQEEIENRENQRIRKRNIKAYPKEWMNSFGDKYYYAQALEGKMRDDLEKSGEMKNVIYDLGEEGVTRGDEAAMKINNIIKEIGEGNV